jgi:hypothetical protein
MEPQWRHCVCAEATKSVISGSNGGRAGGDHADLTAQDTNFLRVATVEECRRLLPFCQVPQQIPPPPGAGEIEKRLKAWRRPEPRIRQGYLRRHSRVASSADEGAVIKHRL